jgi:hypothetical protein
VCSKLQFQGVLSAVCYVPVLKCYNLCMEHTVLTGDTSVMEWQFHDVLSGVFYFLALERYNILRVYCVLENFIIICI